jgi:two-component sensor histidine kinase
MADFQDSINQAELLEQQRVLAEFGEFALRAEDLDAILSQACQLVGRALRTELAKVMELLPDGRTMRVRAGVGWRPGIVGEVTITADENSPEGLTLKESAVISPDIKSETRFSYHDFLKEHGVKAFVNVLILGREERPPFGVLQVDSRSARQFRQSDIEFLRTYANLLGAAIERLRVIDELREAISDKELLISELNHRVKNTLATVQSIVSHTLRNAASPAQARSAVDSRLMALARVHDVLTREKWEAANLREIVAEAIEPYGTRGARRIQASGPAVRVPARVALALAMTFQELATNAVKYGALSNDAGEVKVSWELEADAPRQLQVRWQEIGGPSVAAPTRRGFGTRLIEGSMRRDLGGEVRLDFSVSGVVCTMRIPLDDQREGAPIA